MYRTSEKTSLSRKMAELEDRWRKSQEDRYILELKFKEVLKGLADKNDGAKLLKIREKYYRFLENEGSRNERNDHILRALDKVESQANMLAAKTERLKLLKLHYEAYMKRMYPTWKAESHDEGESLYPKNREPIYPLSHKHQKGNVSYSSPRIEENLTSKLTYHTPRYSDKSPYNSTNMLREGNLEPHVIPNVQSGIDTPGQSRSEKNRLLDLNRDFSNVNINSDGKSGDSRGLSVEQEENTSKDLLNVSLSEDNLVNDSTLPVEVIKMEQEIQNGKKLLYSGNAKVKEATDSQNFRINPNVDYLNLKSDNNNVHLERKMKKGFPNHGVAFGSGRNDDEVDNYNTYDGRSEFRSFPSKEKDTSDMSIRGELNEVRDIGGYPTEFKPSVVITQPTPDIGKSSSEEDLSRKGLPEGNRRKNQHYQSSLETSGVPSEAEISDGERLGSGSGDHFGKVKYSPDEVLRPTTAIGNVGSNVEEPFHFSSSDADYDELENQMAAMVEGKRNDKSIPKVLGDSSYQKSSAGEHKTHDVDGLKVDSGHVPQLDASDGAEEEIGQQNRSRDDISDVSAEEQNISANDEDERLENVVLGKERGSQQVQYEENQSNAMEFVDNSRDDRLSCREQGGNGNLMKWHEKKVKSYDSEKDVEAGGSSIDVNSEILDEDPNLNSEGNARQAEESIQEFQDSMESNVDEENSISNAKRHELYDEQEENVEEGEVDDLHSRDNPQADQLEEEFAQEVQKEEKKYAESEEYGEEYSNKKENDYQVEENAKEYDRDREKDRAKHVEDEINEQRHDEFEDSNVERDTVSEEEEQVRSEMLEGKEGGKYEEVWDEREERDPSSAHEEEESEAANTQQESMESIKEEWEKKTYDQEGDLQSREEEENYYSQEGVEEEKDYETTDQIREPEEGVRYESHGAAEREEREYEGMEIQEDYKDANTEDQVEETEYIRDNTIEEEEEEREYERQETEEQKEYQRHDVIEEQEENENSAEDYRGKEEYEREEQEKEYPRQDVIEEQEENENSTEDYRGKEEYERSGVEEQEEERESEGDEAIEQEDEQKRYDAREEFERCETMDEEKTAESNEDYEEEQDREENEIRQEAEESRDVISTEQGDFREREDLTEELIEQNYEEEGGGGEEIEIQQEVEESRDVIDSEERHEDLTEELIEKSYHKGEGEYSNRENENERTVYEEDDVNEEEKESNTGKYEESTKEPQVVENVRQLTERNEMEHYGHHLAEEARDLKSEEIGSEKEVGQNEECKSQSSGDVLAKESSNEKRYEEIQEVQQGKDVAEENLKTDVKKLATNVEAKEVKKQPEETQKEKKESVRKETEPVAASSQHVEKPERNLKESSPATSRQLTRQFGKKEYDPHKVEKLKSTIRKFQLKKDVKLDKTARKQTESKK